MRLVLLADALPAAGRCTKGSADGDKVFQERVVGRHSALVVFIFIVRALPLWLARTRLQIV
ncbi:protein of unknown function (plasmid) [Rhodovastum atsumiense]|nr:protein of unknown function [Rhodovastum atsumiense]